MHQFTRLEYSQKSGAILGGLFLAEYLIWNFRSYRYTYTSPKIALIPAVCTLYECPSDKRLAQKLKVSTLSGVDVADIIIEELTEKDVKVLKKIADLVSEISANSNKQSSRVPQINPDFYASFCTFERFGT